MNWYSSVFEVIDTRSFSNIWFWIALAVLWSSVSHWVLGVPYDSVVRAKRSQNPRDLEDLHDLVRVNINRILHISELSGIWLGLFGSAFLTTLAITGFGYGIEIAQAVFFLAAPMAILTMMTVSTARKIRASELQGADLIKRLFRHRVATQGLGVVSIFATAMFGMAQNLHIVPVGWF